MPGAPRCGMSLKRMCEGEAESVQWLTMVIGLSEQTNPLLPSYSVRHGELAAMTTRFGK